MTLSIAFAARIRTGVRCAFVVMVIALLPAAHANPLADIGYTRLQEEIGATLPDGSGVLITQVESDKRPACDPDVDPPLDPDPCNMSVYFYMPTPTNSSQFTGKTNNDITAIMVAGLTSEFSSHAQSVGKRFYGNTSSCIPGTSVIDNYLAAHWLGDGFLTPNGIGQPRPRISSSRVAAHAYIGGPANSDLLRRMDWVVDRDEYIHAVGFNGQADYPLFGSAFNVISVNSTGNPATNYAQNVDSDYNGSRVGVDLVAPIDTPSNAAPRVASAAALLVATGHANPALSTDGVETFSVNRNGDRIYNAERSEVIKAALMSGADRRTSNTDVDTSNITDYRLNVADRTVNGLDRRYGAGQLNVYNSYHILTGGEQNSMEDDPSSAGQISARGFDYDPAFGGLSGSNSQANYFFSTGSGATELFASLVWNIEIDGGSGNNFDGAATLRDLNLYLYDISDSANPILVSSSASTVDNTENLSTALEGGKDYVLQVRSQAGPSAFEWDYALAWRLAESPVPLAALGVVMDLLLID